MGGKPRGGVAAAVRPNRTYKRASAAHKKTHKPDWARDGEADGRYPAAEQRRLENQLICSGLPCRTTLEVTDRRAQVVLTPGSGWVHISTPEAVQAAPFPYHISVCAPWQATPQEFAALRNEVDGKDVMIPVERVTRGYCAVVTNIFGPISQSCIQGAGTIR